jgi:hypothetical protein
MSDVQHWLYPVNEYSEQGCHFIDPDSGAEIPVSATNLWDLIDRYPNVRDPYELLLRLVEQRISSASSQEERSRWQRMRAALVDVGKSGAGGLVVELTKAVTGLSA